MTLFEHAMLGATMALACGVQRRHGWGLAVTAAAAAALPDWDGLAIFFGPSAYSRVHRVWGHNFLVAGMGGAVLGAFGYLSHLSTRVRKALRSTAKLEAFSSSHCAIWMQVAGITGVSHVPCDAIFSGTPTANWPVAALWPFSHAGWAWPLVPWGDLGATVIFIVEMFALYRWPRYAQLIAVGTLAAVGGYVGVRAAVTAL